MADDIFKAIREQAELIISGYGKRDDMIARMDEVYNMEMEQPAGAADGLKLTISPDGRNTIIGVVRLMTATAPTFSVALSKNNEEANRYSETMEKAAQSLWAGSNQLQQITVETDICRSLALYDEAYVQVSCLADLAKAKQNNSGMFSWLDDDIEMLAGEVPYTYEIIPPIEAFPLMGRTGMICFVRKQVISVAELIQTYGAGADEAVGKRKRTETLEVREWWDNKYHAVWTGDKAILEPTEHGIGIIPIAYRIANGTRLYRDPDKQRQPLLLGIEKSGLWRDKNVMLTAGMNSVRSFGLNAQFIYRQASTEDQAPQLDWSENGGVITIPPGAELAQMQGNWVSPSAMAMMQQVDAMISDSTVYRSALGAPVSTPTAYATISLLSQSGRLPLVPLQNSAQEILSSCMRITMRWIKLLGSKTKTYQQADAIEIDPAQIPDRVVFSCRLDVDLPQDALRNATVASTLKQAQLVDDRWIHENVLNVQDTNGMKKRIITEQIATALATLTTQEFLKTFQEQQAQKQQQPPQGGPASPQMAASAGPAGPGGAGQGPAFNTGAGGMSPVEAGGMMSGEQAQTLPGGLAGMMGGPNGG